jgi:hypothetical protein
MCGGLVGRKWVTSACVIWEKGRRRLDKGTGHDGRRRRNRSPLPACQPEPAHHLDERPGTCSPATICELHTTGVVQGMGRGVVGL